MSRAVGRVLWAICCGLFVLLVPSSASWASTGPQLGSVSSSLSVGSSSPMARGANVPALFAPMDVASDALPWRWSPDEEFGGWVSLAYELTWEAGDTLLSAPAQTGQYAPAAYIGAAGTVTSAEMSANQVFYDTEGTVDPVASEAGSGVGVLVQYVVGGADEVPDLTLDPASVFGDAVVGDSYALTFPQPDPDPVPPGGPQEVFLSVPQMSLFLGWACLSVLLLGAVGVMQMGRRS